MWWWGTGWGIWGHEARGPRVFESRETQGHTFSPEPPNRTQFCRLLDFSQVHFKVFLLTFLKIDIQLIYNVCVSAKWFSYTYLFFSRFFLPYKLLQNAECSSLCNTVGTWWWSILYIAGWFWGFLGDSMLKNLPANSGDTRDMGWIPESRRPPGEGNGNPLKYSCLENSVDRGAWWATADGGHKELDPTEWTKHACTHLCWS